MKKLTLKNIEKSLGKYSKIIVTGPPRSGTTISGLIIASELGYKFMDESWYDGNDSKKFMSLFWVPRNLVIHTTAFLRDLHTIDKFLKINNIPIVLVKRPTNEIVESMENSKKFDMGALTVNGVFTAMNEEAQEVLFKHYGRHDQPLPDIIYNHFEAFRYKFDENMLYSIKYHSLKEHKLFVDKKERREKFRHLKQVVPDDPYFLKNKRGIMVL